MSSVRPSTRFSIENRNQQESHSHLFLVTPVDKSHEITHLERRKEGREGEGEKFKVVLIKGL